MKFYDVKKMINEYIGRGYLNLDPREKNNIICYYKEDETMEEGWYSVSIEDVASDLFNNKESFKEFNKAINDAIINHMTLTDFLSIFEFDYTIITSNDNMKYLKLIDLTGANLGDIESECFDISNEGFLAIIDRLDNYIQDYIFDELSEDLETKYNLEVDKTSWKEMVKLANELHIHYAFEELVPYIFLEKELKLDAVNKMILNDIEFNFSIESDIDLDEISSSIDDCFEL